jgi:PD-(D/E)XK endonuclease
MKKDSRKPRQPRSHGAPLVRGKLSSKTKGELAELAFSHKAGSLGFGVATPNGEDEAYDFILDSGQRLWRVQVKSIYSPFRHGYRASCGHWNHRHYKTEEIDFVVAYIVPREIWYVIPAHSIVASGTLNFYPSGCQWGGYFESYREAWHLMAPGVHSDGVRIDTRAARP